jgi:hypothetical protein
MKIQRTHKASKGTSRNNRKIAYDKTAEVVYRRGMKAYRKELKELPLDTQRVGASEVERVKKALVKAGISTRVIYALGINKCKQLVKGL